MSDYLSLELVKKIPYYFYQVSEFVTTFGKDTGKNKPFSHSEDFEGKDLKKCKDEAIQYYIERKEGLENSQYFLPFAAAAAADFEFSKHAAYSITLSLIEYYNNYDWMEHPLIGEDAETIAESEETESMVLKEMYERE